jgi:hypothetical protein
MRDGDGWSLDPEAVRRVLQVTQKVGEEFADALREPGVHVEAVLEGSAGAPPVADALAGFFERRERQVRGMPERVQAGITGAASALAWYVRGDEEMAAQQQALTRRAASSGDLTSFEQPG